LSETLAYVYAAILDVLGYRQRLAEDRETDTLAFKDALHNALQELTTINEANYNYQAISDTVIITCSNRDDLVSFLQVLKKIMLAFLKEGLFIRGGLAYSKHFKSSNITYSYAIALAHELEGKIAVYPRIVIDKNIIMMFEGTDDLNKIKISKLVCVQNGVYFLNILDDENWAAVYGWAKDLYHHDERELSEREHEFSKHTWFENYLFSSAFADHHFERYIPSMQQFGVE
jgi:hypothetical protein